MTTTRTLGITIDANGNRFLDKRHRGMRIGMRVGAITQEQAEQRLRMEIQQVDFDIACRAHGRPSFAHCAARYLAQCQAKRSLEAIRVHVPMARVAHRSPQTPTGPRRDAGAVRGRTTRPRRKRDNRQLEPGSCAHDPQSRRSVLSR